MFQEQFSQHLAAFNTSPFLFAGSGLSRRYAPLETWADLLENVALGGIKLPKPFKYYTSNANEDLPKAASIMGAEFNETWWTSADFEPSRSAYAAEVKTKYSPIKYEISRYIQDKQTQVYPALEQEINILKKINIDGIITTNWDTLLESFFPDFAKFIGQEELIFSELFSIGEIYKIHGCATKPESLVLTDEDYDTFHERNPYLAAKLLTIFMEHPIIFAGYSLDDLNIQQILKSIIKCLKKENIDKLKDRLIFCQYSREPIETTMTDSTLLISDTVIPIKLIRVHNYADVFTVLSNHKKKLSVKTLRQMKGMIYEFVKSTSPKSKVYVSDNLDNLEDEHNVEFVYGVGLKERFSDIGIKGIDSRDVFRDTIVSRNWDPHKIAKMYLATAQGRYYPYFKHMSKGGFLDASGMIPENNDIKEFSPAWVKRLNQIDLETFYPAGSYRDKKDEINATYASFSELRAHCEFLHVLVYTPLLDPEKIDLDELAAFLKANLDKLIESKYGTHFRKLICLYDYLKYKYPLTQLEQLT
jgi:hypothetical protein